MISKLPQLFTYLISHHLIGTDATEAFEDIGHSDEARALLPGLLVGDLEENGVCLSFPYSILSFKLAYTTSTIVKQARRKQGKRIHSPPG